MSKIFTDDTGAEYEEAKGEIIPYDKNGIHFPPSVQVIRPVKGPKWMVSLVDAPMNEELYRQVVETYLKGVSEDQAQLIKEALEETLKWVFSDHATRYGINSDSVERWLAVRQSMRENN